MRSIVVLLLTVSLAGCGNSKKKQAEADAHAAAVGFVPPSVTSRLDYGSSSERRFRALDRNGDNVLEADELPRPDSRLMTLDRNGDGRITAEEWGDGMLARFDRMDLNRDGALTSGERQQARTIQGGATQGAPQQGR